MLKFKSSKRTRDKKSDYFRCNQFTFSDNEKQQPINFYESCVFLVLISVFLVALIIGLSEILYYLIKLK